MTLYSEMVLRHWAKRVSYVFKKFERFKKLLKLSPVLSGTLSVVNS